MNLQQIEDITRQLLQSLPDHVTLVAAAKTRTVDEVKAAIRGGVKILGYNYVQEAEQICDEVGDGVQCHMIGHLQRNKVKRAINIFNMIETVDSLRLAQALDHQCAESGIKMPFLIEINSGREENKTGILPQEVDEFVEKVSIYKNIQLQGLMTMGPMFGDPENARPYFKVTRNAFERLAKSAITNIDLRYISMGMSNSYLIAIEEGANIVRIGTKLFGDRE